MSGSTGREPGDTAIGVIPREALASVLALIHREGFGSLARVFDPNRGSVAGQLERAGLPAPSEAAGAGPDLVFLGVTAPGRASKAGHAMLQGGARSVYVTSRSVAHHPLIRDGAEQSTDSAAG